MKFKLNIQKEINDINNKDNSIIICYLNDKSVGFITYDNDKEYWCFSNHIDIYCENYLEYDTLIGLLYELVNHNKCDEFELIKFII